MTTGFVTEYGGGGARDLDSLFHPGSTGLNTGFVSGYRGLDLGVCFDPLDAGAALPFNTGFIAYDGRDLQQWFCAVGTRVADWPVGGGFFLYQNGSERFVTPSITALAGRMGWAINANGADGPQTNLIADRFNLCPGVAAPNASIWQDFGGYQRGVTRRLPAGSVLRFEHLTINLAGAATFDMTCVVGEQIPGWIGTHTGPPPFCSNTSPFFLADSPNLFDFSPGVNLWYGASCPYLNWGTSQNWIVGIASTFCCNINNGTLNEQRVYITRIA